MYALFKLIAQFVLHKLESIPLQLPFTSRPCGWTVPNVRRMDVAKKTVMETTIKKPKLGKNVGVECNLYEARSTKEQMFDAIAKMRENLKEINRQIPMIKCFTEFSCT